MILFLDFDDTLHPSWTFHDGLNGLRAKPYTGPWLIEASTLERILRPYLAETELVISSMWALNKGLETTRKMLPPALAERITDTIWIPEVEDEYRSTLCTRYRCITGWLQLRRSGYEGPWLALDDDDDHWPEAERHHLVHARGTLAKPKVQQELAEKLAAGAVARDSVHGPLTCGTHVEGAED